MKLVIVESPSKAKTIEKYLGKEFAVDASGGHVRDLPAKSLGVDVKNHFEPKYVINPDECVDCGACAGECPVEAPEQQ